MARKKQVKPKKQRPRKYARHTDALRAEALAALDANRGNIMRTARQFDISARTLTHWRDGDRHPEAGKMADEKRGPMADRLEEIAWKLADAIPGKIKAAPLSQVSVSLGIAVDKMRILRGEPTDISELKDDGRLDEFRKRYDQRHAAENPDEHPAEDDAAADAGTDDVGEPADPAHAIPEATGVSGAGE